MRTLAEHGSGAWKKAEGFLDEMVSDEEDEDQLLATPPANGDYRLGFRPAAGSRSIAPLPPPRVQPISRPLAGAPGADEAAEKPATAGEGGEAGVQGPAADSPKMFGTP
ncbi:hypothetical protein T484DRAFT_1855128 [Baffinella frigidus]|nr:hypothetical protein T484DRAFT_1855128 [Cryptophyta sp. CCMP2293]